MWLFGKKYRVGKIAREDDEEDLSFEELPSFAPEILTDEDCLPEETKRGKEKKKDNTAKNAVLEEKEELDIEDQTENITVTDLVNETDAEEEPENAAESAESEKVEDVIDNQDARSPEDLYAKVRALPLSSKAYALFDGKVSEVCPDGKGGVYLFGEFGEYTGVKADDCTAFLRVTGIGGSFRNKNYFSDDLEYIFKEGNFPLCTTAKNNAEYESFAADGFLPFKKAGNGKGLVMIKPMSLYRMKDLFLRVEYTGSGMTDESDVYEIEVQRNTLASVDGAKQFRKLVYRISVLLGETEDPFFTLQVLKVRKNLAVCFPLEGCAETGDRLCGETVTATAPMKDGTVILQLGTDPQVRLSLAEGGSEKGQHRIVLPDNN